MTSLETMIKISLEDIQTEPGKDLRNRIFESISSEIAEPCKSNINNNGINLRKSKTYMIKLVASAAGIFILICILNILNITNVFAFVKNIFFVPGIGATDSDISSMSVDLLKEPVAIYCEFGQFVVEFGTKIKAEESGDKCEITLFLTAVDNIYSSGVYIEDLNAEAVINGKKYILEQGTILGGGNYNTMLCVKSSDFPDINEFDIKFGGVSAHIVMTEMSAEEKTPYLAEENGGITLSAYKYRNNNRFIGYDVASNYNTNGFTQTYTRLSDLPGETRFYDENGEEILFGGGNLKREKNIFESNLSNGLIYLNNAENREVKKMETDSVIVNYTGSYADKDMPKITIPIPKDGETISTDIEFPVGGAVYKITEVRRDGDFMYFKDNCIYPAELSHSVDFDREKAVENREAYITSAWLSGMSTRNSRTDNQITGFAPGDTSFTLTAVSIEVTYYGDFSINFD